MNTVHPVRRLLDRLIEAASPARFEEPDLPHGVPQNPSSFLARRIRQIEVSR